MALIHFVLAIDSWAWDVPLRVVCFPNETPLEKSKFSFASDFQLEIAVGEGEGERKEHKVEQVARIWEEVGKGKENDYNTLSEKRLSIIWYSVLNSRSK